jgi:putative transposase
LIFIYKVSIRSICSLFSFPRSSYYYKEAKDNQAIVLIQKIKDIATTRVRYGYRRIHILLKRQGFKVNHKRIYRLYKETGLQLRNKTPKRRVKAKARKDQIIATAKNDCWSMDFMSDQLFTGQKLRILTIVDNFTKLSPIIDVGFSYKGSNVVLALEKATVIHGLPKVIKVDNGPEEVHPHAIIDELSTVTSLIGLKTTSTLGSAYLKIVGSGEMPLACGSVSFCAPTERDVRIAYP